MTPDHLARQLAWMVEDVCRYSIKGRAKDVEITPEEWGELEMRTQVLFAMNRAVREAKDGHGRKARRRTNPDGVATS